MEILQQYNLRATRRRFITPMLADADMREMAELEKICFPPPQNYTLRTLRGFLSLNGIGLLRCYNGPEESKRLAAFHLFDCLGAELITLDVHPEYRQRGLGSTLLRMSMEKLAALGHQTVHCQIAVDNTPSVRLHQKFGFQILQTLRSYYGRGKDGYLLVATLD